ncbi:MAG: T9SS type A sorting domain-containing protein [Rhodothermales bacterium]|nr:T9SS type A sorting domain-containing protein [Rhodothermales bacterium]
MRRYALLALAAAAVWPSSDALARSWKRFQPLAVGNAWVYDVDRSQGGEVVRERLSVQVIGQLDTLGYTYWRVARTPYDATGRTPLAETRTALFRYDEPTRSVVGLDGALLFPSGIGIGNAPEGTGSSSTRWCGIGSEARAPGCFEDGVGLLRETSEAGRLVLAYARVGGAVVYTAASDPTLTDTEARQPTAFRLWPNPARDVVVAELPTRTPFALIDVTIHDVTGRQVRTYGVQAGFRRLDLSGLASGTYFVRYEGRTRTLVVR